MRTYNQHRSKERPSLESELLRKIDDCQRKYSENVPAPRPRLESTDRQFGRQLKMTSPNSYQDSSGYKSLKSNIQERRTLLQDCQKSKPIRPRFDQQNRTQDSFYPKTKKDNSYYQPNHFQPSVSKASQRLDKSYSKYTYSSNKKQQQPIQPRRDYRAQIRKQTKQNRYVRPVADDYLKVQQYKPKKNYYQKTDRSFEKPVQYSYKRVQPAGHSLNKGGIDHPPRAQIQRICENSRREPLGGGFVSPKVSEPKRIDFGGEGKQETIKKIENIHKLNEQINQRIKLILQNFRDQGK